jgi:Rrf2 family protein
MRLTRAGEYAILCVYFMAKHEKGMVISLKRIAGAMDIPKQFLSKIAQQLSRSGIIDISQGPKGGCRLLVAPEKLSLLDVVEAIMGEILLNDCMLNAETCKRKVACAVHLVWKKAESQLKQTLREATFDKLVKEEPVPCRSMPDSTGVFEFAMHRA